MADEPETCDNAVPGISANVSAAEVAFPNAKSLIGMRLRNRDEIIDDCYVFLDATVLLHPYDSSKHALEEIVSTYRRLNEASRLFVPGQALREFALNRSGKYASRHNSLLNLKSKIASFKSPSPPTTADLESPFLRSLPEYGALVESLSALSEARKPVDEAGRKYNEAASAAGKAVDGIISFLRNTPWNDGVTDAYAIAFSGDIVIEPEQDRDAIFNDARIRYFHKVPPGFKDVGKDDGGIGDYLIWRSILDKCARDGKHALFVSDDKKTDWWLCDGGNRLYPRLELMAEFYQATNGMCFNIALFSEFLELFGAKPDVIAEVRLSEASDKKIYRCCSPADLGQSFESRGELYHDFGRPINDIIDAVPTPVWDWSRTRINPSSVGRHVIFGPYSNDLSRPGDYVVTFRIKGSGFNPDAGVVHGTNVIVLDVIGNFGTYSNWNQRQITSGELARDGYYNYELTVHSDGGGIWEYRALVLDGTSPGVPDNVGTLEAAGPVSIKFLSITVERTATL